MKIGAFLDTDNLPSGNLITEELQFYYEWLGDDYTFGEAVKRSTQRKLAGAELVAIGLVSRAFPIGRQIRNIPASLSGRLNSAAIADIYGSYLYPVGSFGSIGASIIIDKLQSRGGRDAKPGTTVPPVGPGRRPRPPVKPSRSAKAGQTSKPFWANGKPKCKKGFRYDFKRKLCVKIK